MIIRLKSSFPTDRSEQRSAMTAGLSTLAHFLQPRTPPPDFTNEL